MADESVYRVVVDLNADGSSSVRAVRKLATESEDASKKVDASNKTMRASNDETTASFDRVKDGAGRLRGAIGGLAGMIGLGGLGFGLKDVVQSAMSWQKQVSQTENALRSVHQFSKGTLSSITSGAEASSTKGGFGAPAQLQGIANFIRMTGSATAAVKDSRIATMLARGTTNTYSQAQGLIARALGGSTRGLQKYLGIIQPVKTAEFALTQSHGFNLAAMQAQSMALGKLGPLWLKHEEILHNLTPAEVQHAQLLDKQATATAVLARVQQRFGGATQAFSRTASGAWSSLTNAFDNTERGLGQKLLPTLVSVFRWMSSHTGVVLFLAGALGVLAGIYGVVKVATFAWGVTTTVVFGIARALGTAIYAIVPAFVDMGLAATAAWGAATLGAGVAIYLIVTHWKQFKRVVVDVFDWIKANWPLLAGILLAPFTSGFSLIIPLVASHMKTVSHIVGTIGNAFKVAWDAVKSVVSPVINWLVGKIEWLVNKIMWIPRHIASIGRFFGIGADSSKAQIASSWGHLTPQQQSLLRMVGAPTPTSTTLSRSQVQVVNGSPSNALNAATNVAGAGTSSDHAYITVPIQLVMAGGRVIAETVAHTAARRAALSGGGYTSG